MNTIATTSPTPGNDALARLINRDEVLQICYWFRGEGFGDRYDAGLLRPFLQCHETMINTALTDLVEQGDMQTDAGRYRFTDKGQRAAGQLFAEEFADFQRQGHGECAAGCCDGDDHSKCGNECLLH